MREARTITVLFSDVVGSTELLTELGAQGADELRARHLATTRGILAVHRGEEVKTLGDGVMAVFPSAADALSCAVTLQRAAAREPSIRLRVGVSAGECYEEEGDFHGVPVVQASRLCARAQPDQILVAEIVRLLVGPSTLHRLEPLAPMELKGLPGTHPVCELGWDDVEEGGLRVAIADDSTLLRQGIAHALQSEGMDVVLESADAESLLQGLLSARPHVVVVDVRMPPTHTTEGLDAAERIRAEHPGTAVLVLSAVVQASAARRLLEGTTEGVGYLLKDRVGDIADLWEAIRTLARGGSAIDPEVVAQLAPAG